jgi:6-pyruvoyltetrahydropterin/6-carboxytetrahydropterin synthase
MSFTISKRFTFEAAHCVAGLPEGHKCGRLHGHSYAVEVVLAGAALSGPGFVADFAVLDPFREHLAAAFDHRVLNDVIGSEPTSENLARVLFDWCAASIALPGAASVEAVRVSETPATWAEYRPGPPGASA